MNFLWDMVIRAKEQGKKEEELLFTQAEEYSPFFEQAFPCVNESGIPSDVIELNLLYRYADIFQDILAQPLQEELEQWESHLAEFRKYLVDAALHTLLYTDLRYGMTKRDMYIRKLLEELKNGTFWKRAAEMLRYIESRRQSRLAALVLTQMQTGSSLRIFRRSLLVLFPDAVLYQVRENKKQLVLYLKDQKTKPLQEALFFAQDMFLPIRYQLRVFWEYHVGIIGIPATMKIDEIALY